MWGGGGAVLRKKIKELVAIFFLLYSSVVAFHHTLEANVFLMVSPPMRMASKSLFISNICCVLLKLYVQCYHKKSYTGKEEAGGSCITRGIT